MSIIKKIKTGFRLLIEEGSTSFFQALKRNIFPSNNPDEVQIAFNLLNTETKKGLMFDIGAHQGHALSAFAEKNWEIYAFEPESNNRKILESRFGSYPNVNIDPRAISDKPQEKMILYKSKESSGISGLSAFHQSHTPSEEVEVTTLALFLLDQKLSGHQIDLLKIDTEGYDLFVLKGFPWEKNKPRIVICEFEDGKTESLGYNFHDLSKFLISHGYHIIISEWHPIKKYGETHDWYRYAKYPHELKNQKSWGNIIAVSDKKMFNVLVNSCGIK